MVYRCFTEKKLGFDVEAGRLLSELRGNLGICGLTGLRVFCRYDIEGITPEVYQSARAAVFSDVRTDICWDERLPEMPDAAAIIAVEALPGQFDQRADSCAQCIQMLDGGERPLSAAAGIYALFGDLSENDVERIRGRLINQVECRQASLEKPETLVRRYREPAKTEKIRGLISAGEDGLRDILEKYNLAMDIDDLRFVRDYFDKKERRDPTETELRVIDTYWSDHCRHTTFNTIIDSAEIKDPQVLCAYEKYLKARSEVYGEGEAQRPQTLMDIATIGARLLKKRGKLQNLDESEEINACSVRVTANINGEPEPWLLMFKNETHNHPTEIEPFGGAATCIGGAIRDPLSGRAYVYQAMRVTGAGDPTVPFSETLPGKLPQRQLTVTAAAGYSSYGNQIGLATGLVHELYHPNYAAKRMEVGAVVGAVPLGNVDRRRPEPGDAVILLGGRTGRDGIGGATGSSKTHDLSSLAESAAEVQKGNAPEERKIQRLFRKAEVARMIKRCNDFGAGGVSVAIGELAEGVDIDLSKVRKKYEGMSATELAISESQERMAVVISPDDEERFISEARDENLEAYVVARVTDQARVNMFFEGETVAGLERDFLSSNGAKKHAEAKISPLAAVSGLSYAGSPVQKLKKLLSDLRFCSRRGLIERFDGSIGAGSVLMPLGGKYQLTTPQAMAALIPAWEGECSTCSVMAFGFDPYSSMENPFTSAKNAVVTSVAKLVAAGCDPDRAYLSFQEYFERLGRDPARWGKPLSALLGALEAQLELEIAAIGGKDSVSGSFLDMDVPPTLISFALADCEAQRVISPEFKEKDNYVYLFPAGDNLAETKRMWKNIRRIGDFGSIRAAWAVTEGGIIEAAAKMAFGNGIGFEACRELEPELLFKSLPGAVIAESVHPVYGAVLLGKTIAEPELRFCGDSVRLSELISIWEAPLEGVFPTITGGKANAETISRDTKCQISSSERFGKPRAVIPVFPGTNCEYDTARALERAGGEPEIVLIRNLTPALLRDSAERLVKAIKGAQMIILPGGFSGGDEPDGSGKFIAGFFRNPGVVEAVSELLKLKDGLILGICNGFQALIRMGLLPYGEIRDIDENCPTLALNSIGRHQSRYVTTRVCTTASPWLSGMRVGELYTIPVSHGEGRFSAPEETLKALIDRGQIATQYTDELGRASMDIRFNPNGSVMAVEGLISPDGRVFGKMGHSERTGRFTAKNIPGNKFQPVFESGVSYFK